VVTVYVQVGFSLSGCSFSLSDDEDLVGVVGLDVCLHHWVAALNHHALAYLERDEVRHFEVGFDGLRLVEPECLVAVLLSRVDL
jgi:hypothetical protein